MAKLEAKMEIFLELLQEIRDDLKDHPSRSEYDNLKREQEQLRKDVIELQKAHWKQLGIMTTVGFVFTSILSYVMRLMIK